MIRWLLDLLYPPKCVLCHKLLPNSTYAVCPKCARHVLSQYPSRHHGKYFTLCVAPLRYEEPVRGSVHRYKFGNRSFYAEHYAPWMASAVLQELGRDFDLITWVPVSRKRLRRRGYDQAGLLAQQLADLLALPVCPCLKKRWDNPPQSRLDARKDRAKNVRGMYMPLDVAAFKEKRVLLVDDVITTGATLEECSRVLRRAGALQISCATLAMTK